MSDATTIAREPRWLVPLQALLVVVATLLAFQPAFGAEFQRTWDDNQLLTDNPYWRGLGWEQLSWMATAFHMGHYHPLTWLSFAIDYELFGLDGPAFHRTSVLFHAANAVLFLLLARALLRRGGIERAWLPFGAALLWAVHPLRVESVAWITERRDVVSGFLLLATMLAWLRYVDGIRKGWYAAALALFALSLFAKPWGMTLPVVLLALDVWPLRRIRAPLGRCAGSLVLEKLPHFAFAAAIAVSAWLAQRASGAMGYAGEFSLAQKCTQACYGLVFYVRESLLPGPLLPIYDLPRDLDPGEPRFLWSIIAVVVGAAAVLAVARRKPAIAVAFFAYAVLVSPVLGFAQSGRQLVADRYSYLAAMPLVLLFVAALWTVARARAGAGTGTGIGTGIAAVIAALLAAPLAWRTHGYTAVWKDSTSLWNHAVEHAPDSSFAWTHCARLKMMDGDGAGALADLDRALAADPDAAEALENRGLLYRKAGRNDLARADFDRAIAVRPDRAIAYANRGELRFSQGDVAGALTDFEAAVRVDPGSPVNHFNVATAKAQLGDVEGARAAAERALELEPEGTAFHDRVKGALGTLPPR